MRTIVSISVLALLIAASCSDDDSTGPSPTLEGAWDLVGYSDHGVPGVTTGICAFRDDGTFAILGTVTFPGEPVDSLDVSGTYQVVGAAVRLTTPVGTGAWSLRFSGDQCVLGLIGSDPPTTMTLKRRSA